MPRFRIRPINPAFPHAEINSPDASTVLLVVEQMNCHEADIDRDGDYAFSVRLGDIGLWSIYQRNHRTEPPAMRRGSERAS